MVNKMWNSRIEKMNTNELKDLQLKRLKNLVKYVYEKNSFYNKKLKESNVRPEDIKSLENIKKLPFLT